MISNVSRIAQNLVDFVVSNLISISNLFQMLKPTLSSRALDTNDVTGQAWFGRLERPVLEVRRVLDAAP